MFRTLIKILLIAVLAIQPVYAAESVNVGERIRNVGAYIATFFDADVIVNYVADTFISNQCKKRDVFALHAQKDEVADRLLDEYRTLTDAQFEALKQQYAILSAELIYVRNIEDDPEEAVLNSIRVRIKRHRDAIKEMLPEWREKYSDTRQEYEECETSWQAVKEKAQNIKMLAFEIKANAAAFKDQFLATAEELGRTPGEFLSNTVPLVTSGIQQGFIDTINNFETAANEFRRDLAGDEVDTEESYEAEVEQQIEEVREGRTLSQILEEDQNLSRIPELLRRREERVQIDRQRAIDEAVNETIYSFTDNSVFILWNESLKLNSELIQTNEVLNTDNSGVADLLEIIGDRQCRG